MLKGLKDACMDTSVNPHTRDMSVGVPLYLGRGKLRANKIRITDYPKMFQTENTVTYFLDDQAIGKSEVVRGLWGWKGDIMEINPPSHGGHRIPGCLHCSPELVWRLLYSCPPADL